MTGAAGARYFRGAIARGAEGGLKLVDGLVGLLGVEQTMEQPGRVQRQRRPEPRGPGDERLPSEAQGGDLA